MIYSLDEFSKLKGIKYDGINFLSKMYNNNIQVTKYNRRRMIAAKIQGQRWLKQYQIQDLSRSLLRQFLIQHNLSETLQSFQNEDTRYHKKMNKSVLVKMLSMNNLVYNNKNSGRPYKSLLEILVHYLRDKYKNRIEADNQVRENDSDVQTYTNKTQLSNAQNKYRNDSLNKMQIDRSLNNTYNLSNSKADSNNADKNKDRKNLNQNIIYERKLNNQFASNKQKIKRPVTSGHYKHHQHKDKDRVQKDNFIKFKNVQLIYKQLAKEDQRQNERLKKVQQQKMQLQQQRKKKEKQQLQRKRKYQQQQKQKQRKLQEERLRQYQQRLQRQKQRQRLQKQRLQKQNQQRDRIIKQRQQKQRKQKQRQEKQKNQRQKQQKQKRQRQKRQRQLQENERKQKQRAQKQRKQKQRIQKQRLQKQKQQQQKRKKKIQDQKYKLMMQQKIKKQKKQKEQEQAKFILQEKQLQQQIKPNQNQKQVKEIKTQQQKQKVLQVQNKQQQNNNTQKNTRMMGMRKIGKKKQSQQQLKIQKAQPQIQSQVKVSQNQVNIPQIKAVQTPFILQQNLVAQMPLKTQQEQSKNQLQKKDEGQKMVKMFGKKKKQNNQKTQDHQPKKFKFDQNFVDQPLYAQAQKYNYQKFVFNKITIKNPAKPEINYKQKYVIGGKKYLQKPITQAQSQQLKKAVFQGGPSALPKSWFQGFILSPHATTPYGLQQIQGGPCGIIAAVQCYYLKHFLHLASLSQQQMSNEQIRQTCLVAAITDMLLKSKSTDKIILALPPKSFSGTKIDLSNLRIVSIDAGSFAQAFEGIYQHKSYFIGKNNHGVQVLMYCIVMTKGIEKVWEEIDSKENPLIGNHGHCTQELVNLFITGYASSNCFDGTKVIDSQITLKGIEQKSQFGFLTIFQTLKYIQVGKNLKNPTYPFWIICKQFHYHVIFANHYLIAQNNKCQKFDICFFDGLYNCGDRIIITLELYPLGEFGEEVQIKVSDLPMIQQVMMTKWGKRKADWNGSLKIL